MFDYLFLKIHQFLHLLDKPWFDVGFFIKILDGCAFSEGFVHNKLPLAGWFGQEIKQVVKGPLVEILGKSQSIATYLQRPYGLLKGLFVSLADAHGLTHGPHLSAQLVLRALKFLKCPTGKFYHHIVPPGGILIEGPFSPVGYLVEGQSPCQHGGDKGNGKTRGL